ncbi:MAG: NUDIX hydrolase [Treponema sp.]|jgi:8-oxo-dGTP pyrophosphatase MutT (NUDIX family)|nr:NUDIX hydrolase [Treponema sp.]
MSDDKLVWNVQDSAEVYRSRVFRVLERRASSPRGNSKTFTVIEAPDWAIVVPVVNTPGGEHFVMVRQWRHGSRELSLEFPGGVFEPGEDSAVAAARELQEETAYAPGKIRALGKMSPNPAIMGNHVHFFLAEDLRHTGNQDLDDDEFVAVELIPVETVLRNMGKPPYVHALMASALALYLQERS